jgi:hypothetical protein
MGNFPLSIPVMTGAIADLIPRIEAYCRDNGIAEATFGFRAVNDGNLVVRLRSGKTITLNTLARIEAFLSRPQSEAAE